MDRSATPIHLLLNKDFLLLQMHFLLSYQFLDLCLHNGKNNKKKIQSLLYFPLIISHLHLLYQSLSALFQTFSLHMLDILLSPEHQ